MRAPVEFIVTRHLIGDPAATPTEIARACSIERSSASRALSRLRETGLTTPGQLLAHLHSLPSKPYWPTHSFQAPNPDAWTTGAPLHWLTGQAAAAHDGLDLVPSVLEAYVQEADLQAALIAARDIFAKPCGRRDANLVIHVADSWMTLDPASNLIQVGQRWLDYSQDPNVQFAKELQRLE